ncbi:MAG: hypothetical protein ACJ75B_19960 [Flavisolibacter sp.]
MQRDFFEHFNMRKKKYPWRQLVVDTCPASAGVGRRKKRKEKEKEKEH